MMVKKPTKTAKTSRNKSVKPQKGLTPQQELNPQQDVQVVSQGTRVRKNSKRKPLKEQKFRKIDRRHGQVIVEDARGSRSGNDTHRLATGIGTDEGIAKRDDVKRKRDRQEKRDAAQEALKRKELQQIADLEDELGSKGIEFDETLKPADQMVDLVGEMTKAEGRKDALYHIDPTSKRVNVAALDTVTARRKYRENAARWRDVIVGWVVDQGLRQSEVVHQLVSCYGIGESDAKWSWTDAMKMFEKRRVEECQTMMSMGMTQRNIVSMYREKYPTVSYNRIQRITSTAQRNNLELLSITPEQAKADSFSFWYRKLQEAETRKNKAFRELDKANGMIEQVEAALQNAIPGETDYELITKLMDNALGLKKHASMIISYAESDVKSIQDRVDRLRGNYAPERINLTADVNHTVEMKPVTREDQRNALMTLLQDAAALLSPKEQEMLKLPTELPSASGNLPIIIDAEYESRTPVPTGPTSGTSSLGEKQES